MSKLLYSIVGLFGATSSNVVNVISELDVELSAASYTTTFALYVV